MGGEPEKAPAPSVIVYSLHCNGRWSDKLSEKLWGVFTQSFSYKVGRLLKEVGHNFEADMEYSQRLKRPITGPLVSTSAEI